MIKNKMRPIHPGEILREEYLNELDMTPNALAVHLKVPPSRIDQIVKEKRSVSADTAIRLAKFFGGSAQSWMNLQSTYDLRIAEETTLKDIQEEVKPLKIA